MNRAIIARGLVAEPIRITGEVSKLGDQFLLSANPESYQRLP